MLRLANWLSTGGSIAAGIVLVSMTLYTLIEITLRTLFGYSTNVLVEFVGYGLAAMTFLGLGQTLREGGLIRINVALQFAPPLLRRVLDVFCILCGLGVMAVATWYVGADLARSFARGYETDSVVALPQWVPPFGLFIGMLVFIVEMMARLIQVALGHEVLSDESPDV